MSCAISMLPQCRKGWQKIEALKDKTDPRPAHPGAFGVRKLREIGPIDGD